jgi:hypothetical protein
MDRSIDGVSMTSEFQATATRLEIAFILVNGRNREIYVIDTDVLVQPNEIVVRPAQPRVTFQSPATVLFASWLLPLNPLTNRAAPVGAYASRVGPGERYRNTLVLPLPARPQDTKGAEGRIVTCQTVRFELGVIPSAPELEASPQPFGGKNLWRLNFEAWNLQKVLAAEARVSVPVFLTG